MTDGIPHWVNRIRFSQLLRVLLIGFLVLLLQIPIVMISSLIQERSMTRNEAVEDVTGKWGKEQTLAGPVVAVPYVEHWLEDLPTGGQRPRNAVRHASFLPETLAVEGKIESDVRYRGIFGVPVYRMLLEVKGSYQKPDFSEWGIKPDDILWDRAELWLRISDARAIQNQASLNWNGIPIDFAPGTGDSGGSIPGIHIPLKGCLGGVSSQFSFLLTLNGSVGAYFTPMGRETVVELKSNWSNPSFRGNWLPTERRVSDSGFEARWSIPSLGRNYPQRWNSSSDFEKEIVNSRFGLELLSPIDPYRMSTRSVKYEALFLLLTFLSLWQFEVLSRRRIHSLQYLLVGAAMCVFYLLLLSLAEHLGFLSAYLLASVAVVGLITAYCAAILRRAAWTAVIGGLVGALYAYLYVLLRNEDYALLIGALGLFVILAAVMYLTRRTDWYGVGAQMSAQEKSERTGGDSS